MLLVATCISGVSLGTGLKCSERLFRMFVPQILQFCAHIFMAVSARANESRNTLISLLLPMAKEILSSQNYS